MELIMFLWFVLPALIVTVFGVGTYRALVQPETKSEWNETLKRAAVVTRSNLGSKKAKTVLAKEKMALNPYTGADDDERAKAEWTAKFTGQELVLINRDAHRVVDSWNILHQSKETHPGYAQKEPEVRWFWKCSCGEEEYRKTPEAAKMSAKRHVKLYGGRDDTGVKDRGWLRGV